jgi:hypothetical protein
VTFPDLLSAGVGVEVAASGVVRTLAAGVTVSFAVGAAVLAHALTTNTHTARARARTVGTRKS